MKAITVIISMFCCLSHFQAQNLPYLNASTGNRGEYIIDKDTNVFMYSGNKIEKLDKYLNPIWVKTYNGLSFKNLLLSKTGCLFFIATAGTGYADKIGKIENDGSLNWCKALGTPTVATASSTQTISQLSSNNFILDRNNNLVIAGNCFASGGGYAFLYHLDTLGTIIKSCLLDNSTISQPYNVHVISDSSGHYLLGANYVQLGSGPWTVLMSYDDQKKTFKHVVLAFNATDKFVKSKNDFDGFYAVTNYSPSHPTFNLEKFHKTTRKWDISFNPSFTDPKNIDEDKNNNTFLTMGSFDSYSNPYNSWVMKIDSNGNDMNSRTHFIQNYYDQTGNNSNTLLAKLNVFPGQNYFYSIAEANFLTTPLQIAYIDTSLVSNCYPTSVINTTNHTVSSPYNYTSDDTTYQIVPYVMSNVTSTTSAVPNFSTQVNSCIVLSKQGYEMLHQLVLFPNPAISTLEINVSSNITIFESTIFDITGKLILKNKDQKSIDVSKLNPGLYFVKVKTDTGEFSLKFIKE